MRANLAAFERRRIRPRMLTGNVARDISVEVLGLRSPAPFLLAPIGVLSIAHEEAELGVGAAPAAVVGRADGALERRDALARGGRRDRRARAGSSSTGLERPRDLRELRARAPRRAGYGAIVVTLDTLTLGWRPRDLRARLPAVHQGRGLRRSTSATRCSCSRLDKPPGRGSAHRGGDDARDVPEPRARPGTTSTGCARRRRCRCSSRASSRADDAQLALEHGVDGVIVSNHGGRQVDGAVAALDALVEVRDALPDAVVLMDGGIRCAADVVKAMALGADAVLLGRPYAYALAVGGQRGVEELIQNLMAEIDLTLALAGARLGRASSTGRG